MYTGRAQKPMTDHPCLAVSGIPKPPPNTQLILLHFTKRAGTLAMLRHRPDMSGADRSGNAGNGHA